VTDGEVGWRSQAHLCAVTDVPLSQQMAEEMGGRMFAVYTLLAVTRCEDQTSLTMPTIKAIPRGGFWSSLVASQGRFSSLRCGDSPLPRSSASTEGAWIEEWTSAP
jgi:hypothetical protein